MSSYCYSYAQNCNFGCCDANGICPISATNCYYYYNSVIILGVGAIVGIVIGCIVFIVAVIGFSCWLCRRRRRMLAGSGAGVTVVMTGQATGYPPTYGQVAYGQPAYGQNPVGYGQPLNNEVVVGYGKPIPTGQPAYGYGQPNNPMTEQPTFGQPILQQPI